MSSETYIVTAKTVEEAMAIANREYAGAGRDISFDILEMPKKGFLGIGAKGAKIKVTVTEEDISLGSLVAEMKSYKMQTDREGGSREENSQRQQPKKDKNPQKQNENKPENKPADKKPADKKPEQKNPPVKKEGPKEAKPQAPAAEKKEQKPQKPQVQKAPEAKAEPKKEQKAPEKTQPAEKTQPKKEVRRDSGEFRKESRADGRLDSMPEYKFNESAKKTPVHKENGDHVKTYSASPLHTEAVADGSIAAGNAPVADVRWDSARDLKKAEEAAAAAAAAVAARAAAPAPKKSLEKAVEEALAVKEKPVEIRNRNEGSTVDLAAIDAAIEAMVEDLPAPEARKKVGVTAKEMEYALAFTNTLLQNMQVPAEAKAMACPEGEEYEIMEDANQYPAIEIVGEGTGILIGHHGETLDAIQYLLNLAAIRHSDNRNGDYVKISLDIENYRAKREETLRSLARRMAARAVKYKRNVFLEPMNAYERRIIHSELQGVENVSTHSVGTDKNRKIVITYEGADKAPDNRKPRLPGDKKNQDRRRPSHKPAKAEGEDTSAENAEAAGEEKTPNGEKRNRRNRNRRRGGKRSEQTVTAEAQHSGASAIVSAEEKEALDRQLSAVKHQDKPQQRPIEDLPAFLQKTEDEPVEHLREN